MLLENGVVLLQILQPVPLPRQRPLVILCLLLVSAPLLCLQSRYVGGQLDRVFEILGDEVVGLDEGLLETAIAADTNVLGDCTRTHTGEFVVDLGVGVEDVVASNSEDPLAALALLVLTLVKVEAETALGVVSLPLRCGQRQSQSRRQRATHVVSRVGGVGDVQKACQLLDGSLVPLRNGTIDAMLPEDLENVRGSVTSLLWGALAGMSGDPQDDRAQSFLPVIVASREADRLKSRVFDAATLEERNDQWRDGGPNGVKGRIGDSLGGLRSDLEEPGPRSRDREGIRVDIRAPNELGRVARDAVPEVNPLKVAK